MRELDALVRQRNEMEKNRLMLACITGGLAASAAYNAAGATKANNQQFSVADFLPKDEEQTKEEDSPEEVFRQVKMLNTMMGGDKVVNNDSQ